MQGIVFENRIDLHIDILRDDLIQPAAKPADKFFIVDLSFFHK